MPDNLIEIIITGYVNSGKTTLAVELTKFLRQKGFKCLVNDIDVAMNPEVAFKNTDQKMKGLAARSVVTIKTMQRNRQAQLKLMGKTNEEEE